MNLKIMDIYNTRSGINQNDASTYTIIKLYPPVQYEQADEQPNVTPNAIPNAQADGQAAEHIITKLNLLFNYIYNKGNGVEIGLKEKDRECLITHLKRLELYTSNTFAYELMPADKVLDEKIMQWTIKEIYLSPYKVYLGKITRDKFILKYLKTKKYITEKPNYEIEEIINYFIVCLHEEFDHEKR